jgi:pSer/pThr/pTyr-binding forkhead associated (FHA) protein
MINGELRRSANKVFVNGGPHYEHQLKNGDRVTIGASTLRLNSELRNAPPTFATTTSRWATRNLLFPLTT